MDYVIQGFKGSIRRKTYSLLATRSCLVILIFFTYSISKMRGRIFLKTSEMVSIYLAIDIYHRGTANTFEYHLDYSFGILKNSVPNGKRYSKVRSALTERHRKTQTVWRIHRACVTLEFILGEINTLRHKIQFRLTWSTKRNAVSSKGCYYLPYFYQKLR